MFAKPEALKTVSNTQELLLAVIILTIIITTIIYRWVSLSNDTFKEIQPLNLEKEPVRCKIQGSNHPPTSLPKWIQVEYPGQGEASPSPEVMISGGRMSSGGLRVLGARQGQLWGRGPEASTWWYKSRFPEVGIPAGTLDVSGGPGATWSLRSWTTPLFWPCPWWVSRHQCSVLWLFCVLFESN